MKKAIFEAFRHFFKGRNQNSTPFNNEKTSLSLQNSDNLATKETGYKKKNQKLNFL